MKKEYPLKNRFVGFLKANEGILYRVVGEDVKNRTSDKDFDYLLVSDMGQTLALEITSLIDYPEVFAKWNYWWHVTEKIKRYINENDLPGRYLILAPSAFSISKSALSKAARSVAKQISEAAKNIALAGNKQRIRTELGHFEITREHGDPNGIWFRYREYSLLGPDDVKIVLNWLNRIISSKNRQLDTDASRRILLIENIQSYADEESIKEAFRITDPTRLINIDEVYVEFGQNNFEKIYSKK